MEYISTRDTNETPAAFSEILLTGLAPDGGLYIPAHYPEVSPETLQSWRELLATEGYAALVTEVLDLFISDIPREDLAAMARRAYNAEAFGTDEIVRVSRFDDRMFLGHISEGPTAAFKDMAMQLLGELFEYELTRRGQKLNILGATSGDTGSSAEYAMRGRDNINVFMLTPAGRMTPFQQAQMFSLDDDNIYNIALEGTFDDCQDVVKAVAGDADFKAQYSIGAVNSINFARILAQVAYYFALYFKVTESNDQKISFSVPTGNFGNVYAGHVARMMGLPIDQLIVANNENDNLDVFFNTGYYHRKQAGGSIKTSSPSMDISRPSNFERFIYDLLDGEAGRIKDMFGVLVPQGGFNLSEDTKMLDIVPEFGFASGSSTHADRIAEIKDAHERLDTLIDPHTADGVHVARGWLPEIDTDIVVLETALPVKFSETITEAIGSFPPVPERFAEVEGKEHHVVDLPNDAQKVKDFIAQHAAEKEQ
ncbi:threonine synthase [Corynebacterium tapiri]|uniref:Threonine synthase n=1 Tax=Corynebacterium tapiri TaxID=1448266 RepID=A0A5C4U4U4_9CORY|nr:threonine synthase [Corynebacterium tapiri]TNL98727.1 threonine synthase [Corynebacterium tapiri]